MDEKALTIQNGQPETITLSGPRRGAFSDGHGVNFSIASKNAEKVELCLFDATGEHELQRIALPGHTGNVFHGYIPGLKPEQVYGYRVYGPYDPSRGLLFNPAKLSFDPSAQETAGTFIYNDAHLSASPDDPNKPDPRDNAPFMVKARVPEPWPEDNADPDVKPPFPRSDDILYEASIRGLTMQLPPWPDYKVNYQPGVVLLTDPRALIKIPGYMLPGLPAGVTPGTAGAFTSGPVMTHLKRHGNTIELMPPNAGLTERRLVKLGLTNLWNYNALGFFAPDQRLFPGGAREARNTVRELHKAGFKGVLDLAFNHTAEIDDTGSRGYSLSMRGVDNSTYYRLMPDDKSKYVDWTGCGSTINIDEPETQRLILDSLRYWIKEIGADGIRFDLGAILGRDKNGDFSPNHPFMRAMMNDPIISKAELFFEPWDARWSLGDMRPEQKGYQLGNFPPGSAEWDAAYRDDVRDFWRGNEGMAGKMATRLTGSYDIFGHKSTSPHASVNAITFHDGFTMRDLVTYEQKHNEKNKEDNRDGDNNNHSKNYGVEGPTDDPAINALRLQQMRNMRATLFLSQGTPLVVQGDEVGNTQHGNNNGYCQDNEIGHVTWDNSAEARQLEDFSAYVKSLRDEFAVLRHDEYLHGNVLDAYGAPDIAWYAPGGKEQTADDWNNSWARCFGMMLNGAAMEPLKPETPQDKRRLFTIFNASSGAVDFKLPALPGGAAGWTRILDTAEPELRQDTDKTRYQAGQTFDVKGNSIALFVQNPAP